MHILLLHILLTYVAHTAGVSFLPRGEQVHICDYVAMFAIQRLLEKAFADVVAGTFAPAVIDGEDDIESFLGESRGRARMQRLRSSEQRCSTVPSSRVHPSTNLSPSRQH